MCLDETDEFYEETDGSLVAVDQFGGAGDG